LLTPWLSSLWIGLVTPVEPAIARPLIEGLSTPTTVTDPSGVAPFEITPMPFMEALRRALAEDPEVAADARHAQLRLLPDELEKVQRTGAVGSVQAGELRLPEPLSRILNRNFLSRAAREYWHFITRISLGLFRVAYAGDHQCIVLLARPLIPVALPLTGVRAA
jgi:hypothetical protein